MDRNSALFNFCIRVMNGVNLISDNGTVNGFFVIGLIIC